MLRWNYAVSSALVREHQERVRTSARRGRVYRTGPSLLEADGSVRSRATDPHPTAGLRISPGSSFGAAAVGDDLVRPLVVTVTTHS